MFLAVDILQANDFDFLRACSTAAYHIYPTAALQHCRFPYISSCSAAGFHLYPAAALQHTIYIQLQHYISMLLCALVSRVAEDMVLLFS